MTSIRNKTDDVLFMSTGLFEYLSDAESYVFSHVAFFACQKEGRFKGTFKQTTRAICNKVGYSPNTVRKALETLIEKKIHIFCEKPILPYFDNEKNIKIKKLLVANKIIFFSAFQLRYHPFFKNIKNIIKSKKYGNLKFLKMEITESFHLFNKYTNLKNSHYVDKKCWWGCPISTMS